MRPPRRLRPALLAFPCALGLAALAYGRSLGCELQLDDEAAVVRKPAIRDLDAFLRGHAPWEWLGPSRLVTDLTFAVDRRLFGLDVRAYHATNVLLHLAAAVLVLALTRATLRRAGHPRSEGLAVFVAGAFALHPLSSQPVVYVTQRAELLASIFYVASLLLLLRSEEEGLSPRGVARYVLALAAFGLGLGAKAIAVTLPAAYLLHGAAFASRKADGRPLVPWRRRLALASPFLAGAAAFAAAQLAALRGATDAGFDVPSLGPGRYLLTQLRVVLTYLRLEIWPAGQNLDWAFPVSGGPLEGRTLVAGLGILALAGGAALLWRAGRAGEADGARAARLAAFGVLWFLLVLAPTSSVVPIADVLVEHRAYLASWGVLLALAAGGDALLARLVREPRRARIARAALAGAIWLALGAALHARNVVWRSEESIWRDVVAKSPGKARAHANLAHALQKRDPQAALVEFDRALDLVGDGTIRPRDLALNLSAALYDLKRVEEAARVLGRALAESPEDPELLNLLALCDVERRQLSNAEALAREAVDIDPRYAQARNTLGLVLAEKGELAAAASELAAAVRLDPESEPSLVNLAYAQQRLGRRDAACAAWTALSAHARTPDLLQLAARERRIVGCDRR
jgi:tetratricopeptide (TPR) repeat protein